MLETIKSSREIDSLFECGSRASNGRVAILVRPTPEGRGPCGRVVVIAGKKLGHAVLRNRAKRVLRECIRRLGGPWPGYDVAVIARVPTASSDPQEVDRALVEVLKRAGVL